MLRNFRHELVIGHLDLLGSFSYHSLQIVHLTSDLPVQTPFLRQRIGQLQDLHRVKGFLEQQQPIRVSQFAGDLVP